MLKLNFPTTRSDFEVFRRVFFPGSPHPLSYPGYLVTIGAPIRGTGNQGAKTTRNQAIRYAAGYCRILPEIAGYCRILPEIAGNCMRGRGDRILPDIAGYCLILPDFAGFCQILPEHCRILPDFAGRNVWQSSATFGNIWQQWVCRILPDITS